MPVERQVLVSIALCAWVAIWWLAVRAVAGRAFGYFEWVPVAALAFGVPLLVADAAAVSAPGFSEGSFFLWWGGLGAAIDGVWVVSKMLTRLK